VITENLTHYQLLDSGLGRKLEIISGLKVNRPSPQAIWRPLHKEAEWKLATSEVMRTKTEEESGSTKRTPLRTSLSPLRSVERLSSSD
jgi:hypothetical protein